MKCFHPGFLSPTEEEAKENNTVWVHTEFSTWKLTPRNSYRGSSQSSPSLLRKRICVANQLLPQMSNPHIKLKSVLWHEERNTSVSDRLQHWSRVSYTHLKIVLTQQRTAARTNMTPHHKPQFYGFCSQWEEGIFKFLAVKVSQAYHWTISTEDLSLLIIILKLTRYLKERWVQKVEHSIIFLFHSDVALYTVKPVYVHMF